MTTIDPGTGTVQTPTQARGHSQRLPYLPALDGLRALAVIAVLIYHAGLRWMPGGFLGVEIFFTISGYLIASLLLAEWRETSQIVLKQFWLRRARRLLPALFTVIIVALAFSVLFLPDEVASLRKDAAAAFAYSTNWYLIFSHQSYFEAIGRPSLLRHLWSLAVEEQFYVLWPLVFMLTIRRWAERHVRWGVLAGAAISIILMAVLYHPDLDPSRVYYGTDTRAAGILIGVALAFFWAPGRSQGRLDRLPMDLIGFAALGVLLIFCVRITEFDPFLYRGGFALVALSTATLIAAAVHPKAHGLTLTLGAEPLRWIGLRSYGIYLWHWPVFMLTRPQLDVALEGPLLLALRFTATLILAELSYRFVEIPIRSGALERAWAALRQAQGVQRRRLGLRWIGAALVILVFGTVLGSSVVRAQPPPPPSYLAAATTQPSAIPTETPVASTPVHDADTLSRDTPTPTSVPCGAAPSTLAAMSLTATPTPSPQSSATPLIPEPSPTITLTVASTADAPSTPTAVLTATEIAPTRPTTDATDLDIERRTRVRTGADATPTPPVLEHITAIGDSVMMGAGPVLAEAFGDIEVDAVQGRQLYTFQQNLGAVDLIKMRKTDNQLGPIVVLHLGNNGVFSAGNFDEIMRTLADRRRVVVLTVRVPREWESFNNNVIVSGAKRYPNVKLVDWRSITASRPDLFWNDGMHVKPEGARFYADLIAAAITAP